MKNFNCIVLTRTESDFPKKVPVKANLTLTLKVTYAGDAYGSLGPDKQLTQLYQLVKYLTKVLTIACRTVGVRVI